MEQYTENMELAPLKRLKIMKDEKEVINDILSCIDTQPYREYEYLSVDYTYGQKNATFWGDKECAYHYNQLKQLLENGIEDMDIYFRYGHYNEDTYTEMHTRIIVMDRIYMIQEERTIPYCE